MLVPAGILVVVARQALAHLDHAEHAAHLQRTERPMAHHHRQGVLGQRHGHLLHAGRLAAHVHQADARAAMLGQQRDRAFVAQRLHVVDDVHAKIERSAQLVLPQRLGLARSGIDKIERESIEGRTCNLDRRKRFGIVM